MKAFPDKKTSLICLGAYLAMAVVSFLLLSPAFLQELHSDEAIHVLMAQDFSWKHDLYYWGQDRLGSFLPAITSVFLKVVPIHPVWMISIVNHLLLLGGLLLLVSGIRSVLLRLSIALAWFFPLPFLAWNLWISQPYVPMFFLIGLSLLFTRLSHQYTNEYFKKNVFSFLAFFSWMLGAWVHELLIPLLPLFFIYFYISSIRQLESNILVEVKTFVFSLRSLKIWTGVALGILAGFLLYRYAKKSAHAFENQNPVFSEPLNIFSAFTKLGKELWETATFHIDNVLLSVHALALILPLILILWDIVTQRKRVPDAQGFRKERFFLLLGFISFVFVLSSRWVELNLYDSRYFCIVYYSLLPGICFAAEQMLSPLLRKISVGLVITALLISTIISFRFHTGAHVKDGKFSFVEEQVLSKRLGNCGVIGSYWFSYNFAAGDPEKIVATPHEKAFVRSSHCVEEMLRKERVFLVGNDWLEVFPDTLTQFGRHLKKNAEPFTFEHLRLCEYR